MGSGDRDEDALAPTVAGDESHPPADRAAFGPGTKVGRHVLGELLGAGGMGVVYRAQDPELDRALAVKLVRSRGGGSGGRVRLLREAQAMAKLRHPNVVPIFDVGTIGDDVFVVMPFLEGGTLGAWVRAEPRRWTEVVDRYVAAGRGLAAAHAAGLVHRDFKPDNVLVGADGEVQVADFGLARVEREESPPSGPRQTPSGSGDLTRTGDVLGTPAYMAPEQMRGEPSDVRADQFSFCVALWESLFGARPFAPGEGLGATSAPPPSSNRRVPGWVRTVLLRGLRARPAERWPSMTALLDELATRRSAGRRRLFVGGAIVATAMIAGGAFLLQRSDAPPRAEVTYRREPFTRRGDVTQAALSPDGSRVALIASNQLVIRALAEDGDDRVVRTDMEGFGPIAWAPDGRRVAVAGPENHARIRIVDLETATATTVPGRAGYWAFTSNDELATGLFGANKITFRSLASPEPPARECQIPGEFIWPDSVEVDVARGVLVFLVRDSTDRGSLQVMGRDCEHLATIAPPAGVATFAVSSTTHSILMRESHAEIAEVIELAYDGTELGRVRVGGDTDGDLLGRVGDRYYHVESDAKTMLQRVTAGGERSIVLTATTGATGVVAPDGESIAWIEHHDARSGDLRVTTIGALRQRQQPLRGDAAAAGWSIDGARLAVSVRGELGFGLVVMDPRTGTSRTLVEGGLSASSAPAWIDERRVAVPTAENQTFDWVDAETGDRGPLVDLDLGWVFDLCRSPGDGSIAFMLNQRGGRGRQLWWGAPGAAPAVTPVAMASRETVACLPDGLAVYDAVTGTIDRVDPRSGARTPMPGALLVAPQELRDLVSVGDDELLLTVAESIRDVSVSIPER